MVLLSAAQLVVFLGAAVLVTVAPGPDNLMVLGVGVSQGRRGGMAFGLGCAAGCLVHTTLAAAGVSALVAASDTAFTALKVCGGLYLLWLGVQALRSKGGVLVPARQAGAPGVTAGRLFAKGLLANAVNPKVITFFLAFLPHFVDRARGGIGWQTAQLGLAFALQAAVLFGALGYSAGRVGRWLARTPRAGRWLDRIAGSVLAVLGLRLLVSRR